MRQGALLLICFGGIISAQRVERTDGIEREAFEGTWSFAVHPLEVPNASAKADAANVSPREMPSEEHRRRSVGDAVPHAASDLCKAYGRLTCGQVPCATDSHVQAVYCKCGEDEVFDGDTRTCIHRNSCKLFPCSRGNCHDDAGRSSRTCDCSHLSMMGLESDCSVSQDYEEYCEEEGAKAVWDGTMVACTCRKYQTRSKPCEYRYCSDFHYTCKEICEDGILGKDDRCCQGWNSTECSAESAEPYCRPGYLFDKSSGSCVDACTSNQAVDVCENGCSTDPTSDVPFACNCKIGEALEDDRITCKRTPKCSTPEVDDCRQRGGQLCEMDEKKKPKCRCADGRTLINGQCVGHCTLELEGKCSAPFASCRIEKNEGVCTCLHPLVWNEVDRQCELRINAYIVSFTPAPSATAAGTNSRCGHEEDIQEAMFMLYGRANLISLNVLDCTEKYNVQLTFRTPVADPILRRIHLCEYEENIACFFPPALRIERGSASVRPDNLCETSLSSLVSNFSDHYSCTKKDDGSYALVCTDSYRAVTKAPLKNLHVDLCVGRTCNETCTGRGKECVNDRCVCRFDHISRANGTCVEACDPNPCENGGVCVLRKRSTYVCQCAPEFSGLHCELKNEFLHSSRQLVIILSSVLGSLLFLVLISILIVVLVRRRRNSAAARDQLRSEKKLQHCYDGIQRESAIPKEEEHNYVNYVTEL